MTQHLAWGRLFIAWWVSHKERLKSLLVIYEAPVPGRSALWNTQAQTVLLSCTLAWCRLKRKKRSTEPTVIQQPPSLISTLQGKGRWSSERSWKRDWRKNSAVKEGRKLHGTAGFFSCRCNESLRTKLLEVVLFWSGKSDMWITEEEKCWVSEYRVGEPGVRVGADLCWAGAGALHSCDSAAETQRFLQVRGTENRKERRG